MNYAVSLNVRFSRSALVLQDCINFRFEKERYTPYSKLSGQWYCPYSTDLGEVMMVQLTVGEKLIHVGYPTSTEIVKKDGRVVLKVESSSYSAALTTNQCPDGLITDVNLTGLVQKAGFFLPNITYQQDTPSANYVNYYDGTSLWDGIVCYSLRVGEKHYPYLHGVNEIRIDPAEDESILEIDSADLISHSYKTDYTRLISKITMKDVDGTPGEYSRSNTMSTQRMIAKCREINFDREWIMSPDDGLQFKLDYSTREMCAESYTFFGFHGVDILDRISVTDLGFEGEIDRLIVCGTPDKGVYTTVWSYYDRFCR